MRLLDHLHQVAEHSALRAAGGLHLFPELVLIVGRPRGAHHGDGEVVVVVDPGDHVVGAQHVLVQQIAQREEFGIVADRHRRDDLLRIEEDGERPLDRHRGLDRRPGLIDAAHALGEPRVLRVGRRM